MPPLDKDELEHIRARLQKEGEGRLNSLLQDHFDDLAEDPEARFQDKVLAARVQPDGGPQFELFIELAVKEPKE